MWENNTSLSKWSKGQFGASYRELSGDISRSIQLIRLMSFAPMRMVWCYLTWSARPQALIMTMCRQPTLGVCQLGLRGAKVCRVGCGQGTISCPKSKKKARFAEHYIAAHQISCKKSFGMYSNVDLEVWKVKPNQNTCSHTKSLLNRHI
jgi:hypothetical protein